VHPPPHPSSPQACGKHGGNADEGQSARTPAHIPAAADTGASGSVGKLPPATYLPSQNTPRPVPQRSARAQMRALWGQQVHTEETRSTGQQVHTDTSCSHMSNALSGGTHGGLARAGTYHTEVAGNAPAAHDHENAPSTEVATL
jgi:hypothetical protein